MRKGIGIGLAMGLAVSGCILISGQIFTTVNLGDINVTTSGLDRHFVDLNTVSDYASHKANLKSVADFAVLGSITNNGTDSLNVEIWMTKDETNYTTAAQVTTPGNATKLWGPFSLAGGQTKVVDWDTSAGLFTSAGKALMIGEAQGDGSFTLYALGTAGNYSFSIPNAKLVLVLDAGKSS
jgi:hypothetical protein